jgi:hypothetical protein
MSRYRKIDPRFWKDEKIVTLNRDEKLITLYLFTSAQSNRIGLFAFSPAGAAEDLGIALQTFGKGFMEPFQRVVERLNLDWDETFRVLYLPTWWKYNCPENPNVLKSCLADLHEVPQTRLIQEFSSNLKYLPETFHQTFREGLPKPSPQRMADQEQEQNNKSGAKAPEHFSIKRSRKLTRRARAVDPALLREFEGWYAAYPKHVGKEPAQKAWFKLTPDRTLVETIMSATALYANSKDGVEAAYILNPATWLNQKRWTDDLSASGNGHAKPEVKDLGDGFVEVDGRRMDKQMAERRGLNATG